MVQSGWSLRPAGPSHCWPQRPLFVAGSQCSFEVRGGSTHGGRVCATVTGHLAPAAPSLTGCTSGWEVQQGHR